MCFFYGVFVLNLFVCVCVCLCVRLGRDRDSKKCFKEMQNNSKNLPPEKKTEENRKENIGIRKTQKDNG